MNPLEKIKNWYESLNEGVQDEIAVLTSQFHFDETIYIARDESEMTAKFKEYLDSSNLDDKEIVRRTLFIIKLIDISFVGRATESDWTDVLDRHLDMRSNSKERGDSTDLYDNLLDKIPKRKATWIETFNKWDLLINGELRDKNITDWYYIRLGNSLRK